MLREFYGWSESQLLDALNQAQQALAAGITLVSGSAGDINGAGQMSYSPRERITALQRALFELDPNRYAIFSAAGQNRTRIVFSGSPQAALGY